MNYVLFDDKTHQQLLPLTYTRPVSEIRIGILTIAEKWKHYIKEEIRYLTKEYLSFKYPSKIHVENCFINGSVLPDSNLVKKIRALKINQRLMQGAEVLAWTSDSDENDYDRILEMAYEAIEYEGLLLKINYPEDIFRLNGTALINDFELITKGKESAEINSTNMIMGHNIFVEEGAVINCAILNSTTGPIYIGKDAEVMEGSIIRGPFALCEHSTLKMGAKIYGPTTIGPYSKVGGEVNNSVIFGYSNKGHDGFLGNSVIGEWCNIGADSNNSNLKNNYAEVRLWDYTKKSFRKTGLQFCGLIMADHAKCGINTMFNTGTVVGVSANVFGSGFPRNFVPDFAWGGASGFETYLPAKAAEVAEKVFERRDKNFDEIERKILEYVFELTLPYRNF